VTCPSQPPQQSYTLPWGACDNGVGSKCSVGCASGASGVGYQAVCMSVDGVTADWQVIGACAPNGAVGECIRRPPETTVAHENVDAAGTAHWAIEDSC
jgi:hypothetical protein